MFLLPNSFFCIKKKAQQPICLKTNAELSYIIAHLSLTSTKSLAISICAQTRHKLTFDRPTMTTEQDNIRPVILLLHLSCTEDYVHTNPGQVTCFFKRLSESQKSHPTLELKSMDNLCCKITQLSLLTLTYHNLLHQDNIYSEILLF